MAGRSGRQDPPHAPTCTAAGPGLEVTPQSCLRCHQPSSYTGHSFPAAPTWASLDGTRKRTPCTPLTQKWAPPGGLWGHTVVPSSRTCLGDPLQRCAALGAVLSHCPSWASCRWGQSPLPCLLPGWNMSRQVANRAVECQAGGVGPPPTGPPRGLRARPVTQLLTSGGGRLCRPAGQLAAAAFTNALPRSAIWPLTP